MESEIILKFRTFAGKVLILTEYVFLLQQKLNFELIEEIKSNINEFLSINSGDFLISITSHGKVEFKQLWPENNDKLKTGERLNLLSLNLKELNLFIINDGYLYYGEGIKRDPLAIYSLRILMEEIPSQEIEFLELKEFDEVFFANSEKGVVSIYQINDQKISASRFYANFLRKRFLS